MRSEKGSCDGIAVLEVVDVEPDHRCAIGCSHHGLEPVGRWPVDRRTRSYQTFDGRLWRGGLLAGPTWCPPPWVRRGCSVPNHQRSTGDRYHGSLVSSGETCHRAPPTSRPSAVTSSKSPHSSRSPPSDSTVLGRCHLRNEGVQTPDPSPGPHHRRQPDRGRFRPPHTAPSTRSAACPPLPLLSISLTIVSAPAPAAGSGR